MGSGPFFNPPTAQSAELASQVLGALENAVVPGLLAYVIWPGEKVGRGIHFFPAMN